MDYKDNSAERSILLQTEKELRVFMLPLRQRILRELGILGRPLTAKSLADRLGITPSSAAHHLKQLEGIGLVEYDHSESIRGITARYYRHADVTIRVGQDLRDGLENQRSAIVQNSLYQVYEGYSRKVAEMPEGELPYPGDFRSGVAHLTSREAEEFNCLIQNFLQDHSQPGEGTDPWEYALICYRLEP